MSKIASGHNWVVEGRFPFLNRSSDGGASLREAQKCIRELRAILNLDGVPSILEYPDNALEVTVPENKDAIRDQFREVIRRGGFVDWKNPAGKEAIVHLGWGRTVPDFMWYALGTSNIPADYLDTLRALVAPVAFPGLQPMPDSVQLIRDHAFGDSTVMRIHGASVFLPQIGDHVLYAVGNPHGSTNDVYAGGKVLNFADLAKRLQELRG